MSVYVRLLSSMYDDIATFFAEQTTLFRLRRVYYALKRLNTRLRSGLAAESWLILKQAKHFIKTILK